MTEPPILGLDFGGVMAHSEPGASLQFGPPIKRTMLYVTRWTDLGGRVVLISHCGRNTQQVIERWLDLYRFTQWDRYFVRDRWDKEPVARALGIDTMVDDNLQILRTMTTVRQRLWADGDHEWVQVR